MSIGAFEAVRVLSRIVGFALAVCRLTWINYSGNVSNHMSCTWGSRGINSLLEARAVVDQRTAAAMRRCDPKSLADTSGRGSSKVGINAEHQHLATL